MKCLPKEAPLQTHRITGEKLWSKANRKPVVAAHHAECTSVNGRTLLTKSVAMKENRRKKLQRHLKPRSVLVSTSINQSIKQLATPKCQMQIEQLHAPIPHCA